MNKCWRKVVLPGKSVAIPVHGDIYVVLGKPAAITRALHQAGWVRGQVLGER